MSAPQPIKTGAKLGWAAGDFGFNVFWQALNLLMMPFYTDVLGLDSRLAGTVFLIASLWDGFADTIIAAIADRTRTRWGSYRPYLIFASPVLVVSFMIAFLTPDWDQGGLFLYALLSQIFLRTLIRWCRSPTARSQRGFLRTPTSAQAWPGGGCSLPFQAARSSPS